MRNKERILKGIGVSPGIAIGRIFIPERKRKILPRKIEFTDDPQKEISKLEKALEKFKEELKANLKILKPMAKSLIEYYLTLLEDPKFSEEIRKAILSENLKAPSAVLLVSKKYWEKLEKARDPYLRERSVDVKNLAKELVKKILNLDDIKLINIPRNSILFKDDLTLNEALNSAKNGIKGVALMEGGLTSHVAIILKNFEIPAVFGIHDFGDIRGGETAILDGSSGTVIVNPQRKTIATYRKLQSDELGTKDKLKSLIGLEVKTWDNYKVNLCYNIDFPEEIEVIERIEKKCIGLMRTEILFFQNLVDFESQKRIYENISKKVYPFKVTIRVFDLGGDKLLNITEANPFLGLRGLRALLNEKKLLIQQLKAILASNTLGNIKILLPMVSVPEEVEEFLDILNKVKREFNEIPTEPEIGIMIEVPSIAYLLESLKEMISFVSIGTNDLLQYMVAVDRTNPKVHYLYNHLNPGFLRFLDFVVSEAHKYNFTVSVCGEMASDQLSIPILLGMDVDELSVTPSRYLITKRLISELSMERARVLKNHILLLTKTEEVLNALKAFLETNRRV